MKTIRKFLLAASAIILPLAIFTAAHAGPGPAPGPGPKVINVSLIQTPCQLGKLCDLDASPFSQVVFDVNPVNGVKYHCGIDPHGHHVIVGLHGDGDFDFKSIQSNSASRVDYYIEDGKFSDGDGPKKGRIVIQKYSGNETATVGCAKN